MTGAPRRAFIIAWLSVPLAAGCFSPNSVTCSDGTVCPPTYGCDIKNQECVPVAQIEACAGKAEGDDCMAGGVNGTCLSGVCHTPKCGDGVRNDDEQCDGEDIGGETCTSLHFQGGVILGCATDCTFDTSFCFGSPGYCGDGVKSPTEQCDGTDLGGATCATSGTYFDQAPAGRLACTASCTLDLSDCWMGCGDGVKNGGEDCDGAPPPGKSCIDYGFDRGLLGCSADCTPALEGCGDLGWRSASPSGIASPLMGIWGSAANDIYAVSLTGGYAHWDGQSWSGRERGAPVITRLYGVWGSGPADFFFVGAGIRPPGSSPPGSTEAYVVARLTTTPVPLGATAKGIWGTAANDIYAVGSAGAAHFDGKTWSAMASQQELAAVWGSGSADVFAVGGSSVMHSDGSTWSEAYRSADPNQSFTGVWGSGPDDVFVVGDGGAVVHWDGKQWSSMVSGTSRALYGVWGTGPRDAFAVGDGGTMLHWDGARWSAVYASTDRPLYGVWGVGESVFAVGGDSGGTALLKWSRTTWRGPGAGLGLPALNAVWENGPDDIFAVGDGGAIVRGNDGTWRSMTSGTTLPLVAVWGSGPDDVYAVGGDDQAGVVCHWDGDRWSVLGVGSIDAGAPHAFTRVWGSGSGDVFVADSDQGVYHWDGASWSPTGEPPSSGIWGSASDGSADAFGIVDDDLWHMRNGRLEPIGLPVAGSVRGLWVNPGRVDLVGTMGVIQLVLDSATCAGPELCGDGWDNDCDGLQDGSDPDCAGKVSERCANLVDDDGDGKTDCADSDCASFPSCKVRR